MRFGMHRQRRKLILARRCNGTHDADIAADKLAAFTALERKVLWLASWTIHNANHLRENATG